ncbi:PIN domain-containing protein [uncultured Brachyspira sp.]|uniref:PIN domain-containing protein n=1 Tax=uncultured Brachyspira sp. TaxID=221953 RepID=UPI002598091E|nr:PIN domain-containing protein [uncultured Brachyspira sp.]
MNFNKDYPIAILDTNIAITFPNILNILKGCNIVIPYTLIDEIDKVIEEGFCDNNEWRDYNAIDFVNNFLALSEKANLSKDGYKLENDCMLYLDIDKNNLHHKDINLDSKKQDIKFIAEAKNLKEKYNDMEVVLISSDKIMKITASIFDVKVKLLEEFITEYLKEEFKLNILFDLLVESKQYIKRVNKYSVIGGANYYRVTVVREIIFKIVSDNKDIDGLYKLSEIYDSEEIYEKIFEILSENKDIDGLYKLAHNGDMINAFKDMQDITITDVITGKSVNTTRKLSNRISDRIVELENKK